jgi:hypothetical protein
MILPYVPKWNYVKLTLLRSLLIKRSNMKKEVLSTNILQDPLFLYYQNTVFSKTTSGC